MKKLISEFKTFAIKGNVVDLAIGVIIGAAFSKIIASLVENVATPFVSMFFGGVDFSKWSIELPRLFGQDVVIMMNIGLFINTVIEFFILAVVVFLFVKVINKLKRKQSEAPQAPAVPSNEELLLAEIRDLLKNQKDK